MVIVKDIRVYTITRDSLTISWEYKDTTESLDEYTAQVFRSESEVGPFSAVSTKLNAQSNSYFYDTSVNLYNKYRDYHYRVRAEKITTGDYQEYGSTHPDKVIAGEPVGAVVLEAFPDLDAIEAIRRFDLTLQEYIGRKVLVLNSRTTGTRCTNCWDNLKRRRTISDCLTCYGVGIVGGYYSPQKTYACKPPESMKNQVTGIFEMQPTDIVMWFSSRPRLKPRDLIIAEGRRFRVIGLQRSEKLWSLTRQTVQVRELTKDQIEYRISITGWGEDSFSASPRRQFAKSTDIDSYYKFQNEKR